MERGGGRGGGGEGAEEIENWVGEEKIEREEVGNNIDFILDAHP